MFGLLLDQRSKLEEKYQQLLKEAYELSHSNRRLSDLKTAEAESVKEKLETLEARSINDCESRAIRRLAKSQKNK